MQIRTWSLAASNENFDAPLDDYDQKLQLGVGVSGRRYEEPAEREG
jgi:hypothetical protein